MNVIYRDLLATAGASAIRYLGLVDEDGRELQGGGYLRQAVRWHPPVPAVVPQTVTRRVYTPVYLPEPTPVRCPDDDADILALLDLE